MSYTRVLGNPWEEISAEVRQLGVSALCLLATATWLAVSIVISSANGPVTAAGSGVARAVAGMTFAVFLWHTVKSWREIKKAILRLLSSRLFVRIADTINEMFRAPVREFHLIFGNTGLVEVFPARKKANHCLNKLWDTPRNVKRIDIVGHTLSRAFGDPDNPEKHEERQRNILQLVKKGGVIRAIVLSHSDRDLQQLREIGRDVDLAKLFRDYVDKIEGTVRYVRGLREQIRRDGENAVPEEAAEHAHEPAGNRGTLMLKQTSLILQESVMRADNEMLVTTYTSGSPEGDGAPTFYIKGNRSALFNKYRESFEQVWSSACLAGLQDQMRERVRRYWRKADEIKKASSNSTQPLPSPQTAIIFPTYACSTNCSYCLYGRMRSGLPQSQWEIDWELLSDVIDELYDSGVRAFEISGGGEPAEYRDFHKLLDKAIEMSKREDRAYFGLITNGLHLTPEYMDVLGQRFTYTRFSISEQCEDMGTANFQKFEQNLNSMLDKVQGNRPIIGLKFLLRSGNASQMLALFRKYFQAFGQIDHFRVRATREDLDTEYVDRFADELLHIIEQQNEPEKASIDLRKTVYHRNSRCWISPMHAVIAPDGLYSCFNYSADPGRRIHQWAHGGSSRLLWGQDQHRTAIRNLNTQDCARDCYCNCRLFAYQEEFERTEGLRSFLELDGEETSVQDIDRFV